MTIRENVDAVREQMRLACRRCGRAESDVTLIAVTKFVEEARIAEAVAARKGLSPEELAAQTQENGRLLFRIP